MTTQTVTVRPLSSKAKNRLANTMDNNPVCVVEQDTGGELFLASANRKYFFWVATRTGICRFGDKTDGHWLIADGVAGKMMNLRKQVVLRII